MLPQSPTDKLQTAILAQAPKSDQDYNDIFEALDSAFGLCVSVLDENLRYIFIGKNFYHAIGLADHELKIGDTLQKGHELMIQKGLISQGFIDKNNLNPDKRKKISLESNNRTQLLSTIGGKTHKITRMILPGNKYLTIGFDITQIYEKEKLLNLALAVGNAAFWTYNFQTGLYDINPTMQTFLGAKNLQNVHDKGIATIVHPEEMHILDTALRNFPETGQFDIVVRSINHKDKYEWVRVSAIGSKDHEGEWYSLQAFVKNINKERLQAQELEKTKDIAIAASRAKSEFFANMSHEIRTPMNGIIGMTELLANSDITSDQAEYIDVINKSARSLLTVINDILDFSKIETGNLKLNIGLFNLRETFRGALTQHIAEAKKKNLKISLNYPDHLPENFVGDENYIGQLIKNLLGNAVKFTQKGHVAIDVLTSKPRQNRTILTLRIKDTGIGIPAEKIKYIFNRFTQIDGSSKREYGGLGLGLSLSKHIVELMSGRIQVQSEVGKGSIFSVSIPLKLEETPNSIAPEPKNIPVQIKPQLTPPIKLETVSPPPQMTDTTPIQSLPGPVLTSQIEAKTLRSQKGASKENSGKKHILVAEDFQLNREVIRLILLETDYLPVFAENGIIAFDLYKKEPEKYALIVMDVSMPVMDGLTSTRKIRSHENLSHLSRIPIIALTAHTLPKDQKACIDAGMDDFLAKPVDLKTLVEKLEHYTQPKRVETRRSA